MSPLAPIQPEKVEQVKRSELRQHQRAVLRKVKGRRVVVITAREEGEEKLVLDKQYFDDLLEKLRSAIETLEITTDQRLFSQILGAAETVDDDIRLGKLRSFEEAFGEE